MKKKYQNDMDFQDIRIQNGLEQLDIYELLDEGGFEYSDEGRNISSGFIGISPCPECGDTRFHAALKKDEFFITCFICKCHLSPIKTVAYLKHTNVYNAAKYLIELGEGDEEDIEQRVRNVLKTNHREKDYSYRGTDPLPENKIITKAIIKRDKQLSLFLKERRIKSWEINKYDLRIGINKNKLIFPIYVDNKLVSYQSRRIDRKQYHVPQFLSHYLLWEDEISNKKPLIIVEGYLDAIRIKTFVDLFYKNQFCITTGFVKSISAEQIKILIEKNPKYLITVFDSKAWWDYKRLKDNLPFDVTFVTIPDNGCKEKDPSSLSYRELKLLFQEQICYE